MYKLEIYQKGFIEFVCGSLTNIKTSNQDEETKAGPNGTTQEKEV
jgi:hypothetical protein